MSFLQGQEKMSKSDPNSAVFMEDSEGDVNVKIKKAFCPPQARDIFWGLGEGPRGGGRGRKGEDTGNAGRGTAGRLSTKVASTRLQADPYDDLTNVTSSYLSAPLLSSPSHPTPAPLSPARPALTGLTLPPAQLPGAAPPGGMSCLE
jgi:hypothetical protein